MPASTLADVVNGALGAIGQLGVGQSLGPEDANLGLRLTNLLLSKATTRRSMLYSVKTRTYQLTAGVVDYTIGQGGGATFTDPRPVLIESAQVTPIGTSLVLPVSIVAKPAWDAIRNKGATADVPDTLYPEYTYPNMAFHINPKTLVGPINILLGCWEELQKFATIMDAVSFPDAYEEYLESNLGILMAPYYDQPIPQSLAQRAVMAEMAVIDYNVQALGTAVTDGQRLQSPNVGQPRATPPAAAPPAAPAPPGAQG